MNDQKPNVIERAFEIAANGQCRAVSEIASRLNREGYEGVHAHLSGMATKRLLKAAIEAARSTDRV